MEPRLYMRHARQVRGRGVTCLLGIRGWAAMHGIDLRKFNREGLPGEEALRIGDAFALAVLQRAREESAHGRQ